MVGLNRTELCLFIFLVFFTPGLLSKRKSVVKAYSDHSQQGREDEGMTKQGKSRGEINISRASKHLQTWKLDGDLKLRRKNLGRRRKSFKRKFCNRLLNKNGKVASEKREKYCKLGKRKQRNSEDKDRTKRALNQASRWLYTNNPDRVTLTGLPCHWKH